MTDAQEYVIPSSTAVVFRCKNFAIDSEFDVSLPISFLIRMFIDIYETRELMMIRQMYDKRDRILELGACTGYTTIILAKKCEQVVALEPTPESFDIAQRNIESNHLDNTILIRAMASDHDGTAQYNYRSLLYGSSEFPDAPGCENDTQEVITVETEDVNRLISEYNINALHMDVEGSEKTVLPHILNGPFAHRIQKVSFETHTHLIGIDGNNDLFRQLIKSGFEVCMICGDYLYPSKCYVISFAREPYATEIRSGGMYGDVRLVNKDVFWEQVK